ncbi:MAG: rod shape-determining protein RodA [Armatimonadetes bacterium]|nr:rod shape-determining protein RodA [Armatimonadota bacterium]
MARSLVIFDWRRVDWLLLICVLLLVAMALPTVYSAGLVGDNTAAAWALVKRQALWLLVGLGALALVNSLDYHHYAHLARWLLGAALLLLVAVLIFGTEINGAKAWFRFGPVALQPSELAKIATLLTLADFLGGRGQGPLSGADILHSGGILALPICLIMLQPDLGTSLTFIAMWLAMLAWAGARARHLAAIVLAGLLLFALMWHFGVLADYQKNRITVLFNPGVDPRGVGYNMTQSLIAVGSGGLTGQGWLQGTQTHLRFLPEGQTDFIFAVFCEEWGLLGAAALLGCYLGLFWRIWGTLCSADSEFGRLLVTGCGAVLLFHVLLNVGMVVGLVPITGLPLPFVSYGGSNLLTSLVLVGIVINVGLRR